MKFLSATALLVCAAPLSVAAQSLPFFGSSQSPIQTKEIKYVEGNNPLQYCQEDTAGDILQIGSVDLTPNPPLPGKTLTIEAKGVLRERIEKGAKVLLVVKYGLITLIRQTADLCDQLVNVDMKCPLEKGDMILTKKVDLPKQIPPGKYSVHADVLTEDGKTITCLEGVNIEFKAGF
ncbi:ML domain-containing protein [Aspergillus candidus]|uniref:Phosphatidylglycerol/phosphatidylinositol transfer protein n=1 Tax=Aspergillus candidus TaxID=41067 RepID=A0A2I2F0P0_ASPCN|nr:ML domain-domain-containing protein [Aspergillus candidus]PLB34193.1 ML domain-domain-containing protein [Aspergillus candidus]